MLMSCCGAATMMRSTFNSHAAGTSPSILPQAKRRRSAKPPGAMVVMTLASRCRHETRAAATRAGTLRRRCQRRSCPGISFGSVRHEQLTSVKLYVWSLASSPASWRPRDAYAGQCFPIPRPAVPRSTEVAVLQRDQFDELRLVAAPGGEVDGEPADELRDVLRRMPRRAPIP